MQSSSFANKKRTVRFVGYSTSASFLLAKRDTMDEDEDLLVDADVDMPLSKLLLFRA
jgi:hypothetical protein